MRARRSQLQAPCRDCTEREMENSVLQWLCESGGLLMLQEQCKKYKEEAHKVLWEVECIIMGSDL